jgi:hypothetical protein
MKSREPALLSCSPIRAGRRDLLDVPVVGATASAQYIDVWKLCEKRPVLPSEGGGVSFV